MQVRWLKQQVRQVLDAQAAGRLDDVEGGRSIQRLMADVPASVKFAAATCFNGRSDSTFRVPQGVRRPARADILAGYGDDFPASHPRTVAVLAVAMFEGALLRPAPAGGLREWNKDERIYLDFVHWVAFSDHPLADVLRMHHADGSFDRLLWGLGGPAMLAHADPAPAQWLPLWGLSLFLTQSDELTMLFDGRISAEFCDLWALWDAIGVDLHAPCRVRMLDELYRAHSLPDAAQRRAVAKSVLYELIATLRDESSQALTHEQAEAWARMRNDLGALTSKPSSRAKLVDLDAYKNKRRVYVAS